MLSYIVRMTFEQDDRHEIADMLCKLTAASRSEAGCVSFIPHFVEGEPCVVLIYEQYADEVALEHHRATPHFHQYVVGGLYQKMRERRIEDLVAVC
jgi:quinol monooxygenase YgiN